MILSWTTMKSHDLARCLGRIQHSHKPPVQDSIPEGVAAKLKAQAENRRRASNSGFWTKICWKISNCQFLEVWMVYDGPQLGDQTLPGFQFRNNAGICAMAAHGLCGLFSHGYRWVGVKWIVIFVLFWNLFFSLSKKNRVIHSSILLTYMHPYVRHAEYLRDTSSVHDIWPHQGPWAWASSISGKHRREPTACIGDSTHRCLTW